jgi:hypothetical protein
LAGHRVFSSRAIVGSHLTVEVVEDWIRTDTRHRGRYAVLLELAARMASAD